MTQLIKNRGQSPGNPGSGAAAPVDRDAGNGLPLALRTGVRGGIRQMSGVCDAECMDACMNDRRQSREWCEMNMCEVW
jgi:hypothetical protein